MTALFDVDQVKNISEIDLCPQSDNGNTSSHVINSTYLRQYRLNQRRRRRQLTIFSDEDEAFMSHEPVAAAQDDATTCNHSNDDEESADFNADRSGHVTQPHNTNDEEEESANSVQIDLSV